MIHTGTYKSSFKLGLGTFPDITLYPSVVNHELAYTDLIAVHVEGEQFDIIRTGTPGNRKVLYKRSLGALMFDINMGTKSVFVIYQR